MGYQPVARLEAGDPRLKTHLTFLPTPAPSLPAPPKLIHINSDLDFGARSLSLCWPSPDGLSYERGCTTGWVQWSELFQHRVCCFL